MRDGRSGPRPTIEASTTEHADVVTSIQSVPRVNSNSITTLGTTRTPIGRKATREHLYDGWHLLARRGDLLPSNCWSRGSGLEPLANFGAYVNWAVGVSFPQGPAPCVCLHVKVTLIRQ